MNVWWIGYPSQRQGWFGSFAFWWNFRLFESKNSNPCTRFWISVTTLLATLSISPPRSDESDDVESRSLCSLKKNVLNISINLMGARTQTVRRNYWEKTRFRWKKTELNNKVKENSTNPKLKKLCDKVDWKEIKFWNSVNKRGSKTK